MGETLRLPANQRNPQNYRKSNITNRDKKKIGTLDTAVMQLVASQHQQSLHLERKQIAHHHLQLQILTLAWKTNKKETKGEKKEVERKKEYTSISQP